MPLSAGILTFDSVHILILFCRSMILQWIERNQKSNLVCTKYKRCFQGLKEESIFQKTMNIFHTGDFSGYLCGTKIVKSNFSFLKCVCKVQTRNNMDKKY